MIELLLQADRLLNMGMTDQADTIYRRVAEQDPQNAIAVVGLARCALAREDDHEAYRLAARALTIDPQNDMARRMEARLTEVLTLRGEAPGRPAAAATDPGAGTTTELRPLVTRETPATPATVTAAPATAAAATPTPHAPHGAGGTRGPVPRPSHRGAAASAVPSTPVAPTAPAAPRRTAPAASRPRSPLPSSAATTRSILGRLLGR